MSRPYLALCDDGHDHVCYSEDTTCPACNIREELSLDIESLREEIGELEDQIKEYEAEETSVLEDK